MTFRAALLVTLAFVLISLCSTLHASEWYVDVTVVASGDGTSPETAFKTIAEGVAAASDGDEVTVAPGTYVENVDFGGKNIILRSTHLTDPAVVETTIIDGNAASPAVTFAGTEDETCVLSGFTIRNGNGGSGGGIHGGTAEQHGQATIQNNIIIGNSAAYGGGMAYCDGLIRNNLVAGNTAEENGGGLDSCGGTIQNNTIVHNSAYRGGGMYGCPGPTSNCILWGNTASYGSQSRFCYDFSYCCVQGGVSGEGNITDNPRFIDADGPDDDPETVEDNDYHVWVGSQCIDVGKNEAWMSEAVDLDRNPRILLGRVSETVDIGAYEFVFTGPTAETWYVDDSVTASGDGKTPEAAFKTIQEGIDASSDAGDTVIVAEGTYEENIDFRGRNITLRSTDPTDRAIVETTIIDGNQAGSVVTFAGTEDETCVLSGFTIRNGNGNAGGGIRAGMSEYHSLAIIENNIITGNSAGNGGGVAYCDGLIGNNRIYGNTSTVTGGGLHECNGVIRNNLIAGNTAEENGGGLDSCGGPIQNNTIVYNSAYRGGGMYGCPGPTSNCILWGNAASYGSQSRFCYDFSYCCVQGGISGEGNIQDDPAFVDADGPDDDPHTFEDNEYHLLVDSPCVDAGKNEDWMWRAYDLAHFPRILPRTSNWKVDMGAYEYPVLNSVMMTTGREDEPQVIWISEPGSTYVVWSCADLLVGDWQEEATVSSIGSITSWIDPDTASYRQKFYKIEDR
jgi:hypothetical protein